MKYILFALIYLMCIVNTSEIHDNKICELSIKMKTDILMNNKFSIQLSKKIGEKYDSCVHDKKTGKIMIGALIGVLIAPYLAPVLLSGGLVGAAALTHGLAVLGGGSLAIGGFGMAGGLITSGIIGATVATSLDDYDNQCLQSALNKFDLQDQYYDYFEYPNGIRLYEGVLINKIPNGIGTLFDISGKVLFNGKFKNGIPEVCF